MRKQKVKVGVKKTGIGKEAHDLPGSIAYRLKCAKTANGLSHFVMYGDVEKEKTVL